MGWEPAETVTYEYDDSGRLVRSVVVREPEWTDEESGLVVAYMAWQRTLDPNGVPLDEATAEAADPNNYDGGYRFVARGPRVNWAEKARLDAIDAWRRAAGENPNMNGMFWHVERVDE